MILANLVAVDHRLCIRIPDNISMAHASTLQSAYLVSYYGLFYKAQLSRGMSCLIHSGMGGVVTF